MTIFRSAMAGKVQELMAKLLGCIWRLLLIKWQITNPHYVPGILHETD